MNLHAPQVNPGSQEPEALVQGPPTGTRMLKCSQFSSVCISEQNISIWYNLHAKIDLSL